MKHVFFLRLVSLLGIVSLSLVPGCGQKDVSLVPVSGKVTVDGKPLTSGGVSLIPDLPPGDEGVKQASKLQSLGMSGGEIGPDGTYKIMTGGKEGAPLGKYKVRIIPSVVEAKEDEKEPPDIGFDKKYTDANKTPLHIEVVSSPKPGQYDLKLTK